PRMLRVRADVHDAGGVVVSVADTGAGISSQDVDQIFNPLFTTKSGGMGMGLWICRSIIEAHDGRLWVAQNIPRGAVFQFVLRSEPLRLSAFSSLLKNPRHDRGVMIHFCIANRVGG